MAMDRRTANPVNAVHGSSGRHERLGRARSPNLNFSAIRCFTGSRLLHHEEILLVSTVFPVGPG
jgi:hypothetical protein